MSNKDDYGVYALYRPNGRICYVGKGRKNRPEQHFSKGQSSRNRHLKSIISNAGGELSYDWLIFGISELQALAEEIKFIADIGREPNGPLVNLTDGGDGCSGLRHSVETREKLANLVRGHKQSPETISKRVAKLIGRKMPDRTSERLERQASKLRGRKHTDEHKAKIGLSQLGKKRSDEAKANMSKAQRGRKVTDETRAKQSAAHKGKKQSCETIEKRIAPLRGQKRDASTVAKISAAQKGRPKNPESVAKMTATMRSPEILAKTSGENHWRAKRRKAMQLAFNLAAD